MRWLTILISITLLHDIFAPHPTLISIQRTDGQASIGSLDVCSASSHRIAEDDEMPTVAERSGTATPGRSFGYCAPACPVFVPLLLAAPDEHPPQN